MTPALAYLQVHSMKNRFLTRLKRLKKPKYMFGAIVGGAYLYFYFFRYLFHASSSGGTVAGTSPEDLALLKSLAALVLFVIILLAWIIPHERAALTFSEAEVAFLFPAPIKRSELIQFKLLRSQFGIFFTSFFLMLVFNRHSGHAWFRALGWWLALSTLNLHFLGSSFVRTALLDHGISNLKRRLFVFGLVLATAIAVVFWAEKALPRLDASEMHGLAGVKSYAHQLFSAGPVPYLLYPFKLLVRPYFATDLSEFLRALGPAFFLLALHYLWVVRSDVAFEEASIAASQKLAERISAAHAGNWRGAGRAIKKKRAPFRLRPSGFPSFALLWKNLIGAGQLFSLRMWIIIAVVAAVFLSTSGAISQGSGVVSALGMLSAMFLGWSVLAGPQFLRQDLRQDLVNADILKSFPMRGWQIVLGEVLAPVVILTGLQWLLLIFGSPVLGRIPGMTRPLSLVITLSTGILLPALNSVLMLIPNAGVLIFPAWFAGGKDGVQGIEATGQRLIIMLGQLLAFAVALIPGAAFFAIVFIISKIFMGPTIALLPSSCIAGLVLILESGVGILMLGRLFDRFDLSAELASQN